MDNNLLIAVVLVFLGVVCLIIQTEAGRRIQQEQLKEIREVLGTEVGAMRQPVDAGSTHLFEIKELAQASLNLNKESSKETSELLGSLNSTMTNSVKSAAELISKHSKQDASIISDTIKSAVEFSTKESKQELAQVKKEIQSLTESMSRLEQQIDALRKSLEESVRF